LEPVADGGAAVVDVCRQIGISEATLYTWKKEYAELGVSELRKLKQLEDEKPWGRGRWLGL
jgi:putative transposase